MFFFIFLFFILRSCIIFLPLFFLTEGLLFFYFTSGIISQTLLINSLLSFNRWLYSLFHSCLCSVLFIMLSSIYQAFESNADGNFILGKTGCVSSFDSTAWIFSALILILALVFWRLICVGRVLLLKRCLKNMTHFSLIHHSLPFGTWISNQRRIKNPLGILHSWSVF